MATKRYPQRPIDLLSPTRINLSQYLINHNFQITDGGNSTSGSPIGTPGLFVGLTHNLCLINSTCASLCCQERTTLAPLAEDLLALYEFDLGHGQTILDKSGNALNAIFGATTASGADDPSWNPHGILFGSGSIVTIPNTGGAFSLTSSGFSIIAGLRLNGGTFPNDIVTDSTRDNLRLSRASGGTDLLVRLDGTDILIASGFFTASAFSGIIGVSIISGLNVRVFKNGLLFASGAHSSSFPSFTEDFTLSSGAAPLNIGSEFYKLAFYNQALSITEQKYMASVFDQIFEEREILKEG